MTSCTYIYIGIDYYDKDDNRYVGQLIESDFLFYRRIDNIVSTKF